MNEDKKVVLAYSGGLDTSVMIAWLKEKYGLEAIAVLVDAGRASRLEELRQKALSIGAAESIVIDAREEFAHDFVLPSLAANALYEERYPLVSALSRPLICKLLVGVAHKAGAVAVAHGCTAKGNDQVRFDLGIRALDPSLEILAPAREWGMTREQALEYAVAHDIPVPLKKDSPYSIDENLWGRAVECGPLEDPWQEPPGDAYAVTCAPEAAPDEPAYLEIGFEAGEPVSLNGSEMPMVDLIDRVDGIGAAHGFGRIDMIENRLVGIKSREVYETPGALALIMAHRDLEDLVLPRDLSHFKRSLERKFADMLYNGGWFDPLMVALRAFMEETQRRVSGTVRLKYYKGSCKVVGRKSANSLYDLGLATYGGGDIFSHEAAKGFCELFGLPLEVWARKER
ncbi:MAG: argininosuccinate synthase [Actinomycetota bacterium]|jgi:argininosuccinate synthase|nr:argininosuccinate synthase [Actinomycetota bacterium]MCL6093770.1 argininosuccinate synthase [Actinomycetota bacterium]MDA8166606.1 argininosuccinate synthase [Actinomycetota bacterium]